MFSKIFSVKLLLNFVNYIGLSRRRLKYFFEAIRKESSGGVVQQGDERRRLVRVTCPFCKRKP